MTPTKKSAAAQWTIGELIDRCLAREDRAWQEFLRRYSRLIYSTILKAGLGPDDADDAFQTTMAAVYAGMGRLRRRERLSAWIIAVAWRQAINCFRRNARHPLAEGASRRLLEGRADVPATERLPSETRLLLERAQQAQEAMEALPERCRRLLRYLFYEDPPPDYAEIARREGCPMGSLGPTRVRCIEKMRRYFLDRGWMP